MCMFYPGDILPHCDLVKDQHDANTDSFMIDGETCTNINPYSVRFCTGRCSPNNICIASATEFKRIKIKCGEGMYGTRYTIILDMKGCMCNFVKWPMHPFISKCVYYYTTLLLEDIKVEFPSTNPR